ncbi:DUF305 domain-containing protein [Micromonospora polyrhachis]|uniref:Uncharacterized protein (DUF305 family) n=1 Tax=Micromonospora polyrhachis TaxID=1282883 RepID=A0A7W7SRZ0_9ACTN|nr:DUF305 domain-containing protein [Micromonospora polyrhachis]MBB4959849.1 uncharacterized protein (DUF305 family) [Micromonospora polyrhachis]
MRNLPTIRRATGAAVAAVAALAFAAGCGDDSHDSGHDGGANPTVSTSTQAGAEQHNQADISFAQGMIPHHQQAVEMSNLAETRAGAEVKALAAKIKQAQAPEIQQMTDWLRQWGAPLPSSPAGGHGQTSDGHGSHGGGHEGMTGMMTEQEMTELTASTGAKFDRMFLEMMIRHHEGAVQMATTEQQQGQNPAAKKLAGEIIAAQNTEIQEMRALLAKQ